MSRILIGLLVCVFAVTSVRAENVIQYITASQQGVSLPSSTNQVTDLVTCMSANEANAQSAPSFGYVVDEASANYSSVTYTDPASKITVTQNCVPAPGWIDPLPKRPLSGARIPLLPAQVPCPKPTANTLVLLTLGQSHAANNVESRYTSGPNAFMFSDGNCYPLADPGIGADGDDGSIWSRLADMLLATGRYDQIIVSPAAQSSSSVKQWAPGGNINAHLLDKVQKAAANGLPVTHMLWDQGVADAGTLSASQWRDYFSSVLGSIRAVNVPGSDAQIFVARHTRCNIRSGNMSPQQINDLIFRGPDKIIKSEAGKQAIRLGQQLVVNGRDVRQGPNLDAIGSEYTFDGCHQSRIGALLHAKAWRDLLTAQ